MAGIYFDARINGEQLQRDIADINKQLKNLTTDVEKTGRGIDSTFKNLGGLLAGYFTFNFAGNMVKQIAQVRGEFQQLEVAFETMIGNKARADALMADVVRMASTTPFELKEVASGAKSLLAFGIATEDIIPTLKSLGDVSAGLSVPMERLILNFGQIKTQSKLTGKELRDFNVAGVPIIAELAKNLGKSEQAIQDMVSAGNIGFQEVADAFKSMSSEGGRFANLMDKQAKTIIGLQSNLRDAIDQMFNSIGESQEGAISSVLKTAISLVENYEKVIDILKILVVTYGAYKAALMTVAAWQAISTKYAVMDIATKKLQIGATLKAAAAQSTLNTAMKLNPYVLAAAAIAGFVTILTTSIKKKREAAEAAAEFADSLETETYNVNKAFEAIKNTTEGTNERAKAIQAVNTQYGTYLPAMLTEASTLDQVAEAQRNVTNAIIETISARNKEAQLKPLTESVERTATTYAERVNKALEKVIGGVAKGEVRGQLQNLLDDTIQRAMIMGGDVDTAAVKKRIEYIFESYGKGAKLGTVQLANLVGSIYNAATANENLRVGTNQLNETTKAYLRTLGLTDEQIGTTSEQISKTVSQQIADTTKAISDAQAELNRLRQPTSVATEDQIKAQEGIIKDLRGKLETLTGISRKAANEQSKIEDERIEAEKDYHSESLANAVKLEADKLAAMTEGYQKRRAEAETQLGLDLAQIESERNQMLEKYNKMMGNKPGSAQYVTTLSDDQENTFNQRKLQKTIEFNNKIEELNRERIDRTNQLEREATDFYISEQDREIRAVQEKYDELIKEAKSLGSTSLLAKLEKAKKDEIEKINRDYNLSRIDGEIAVLEELKNMSEEEVVMNADKYKAIIKQLIAYQNVKLKAMESDPNADKAEIQRIKNVVKEYEKAIKEINKKLGTFTANAVSELTGFMGKYTEGFEEISTIASGIGRVIAGDWTGGLQVMEGLIGIFENAAKKSQEMYQAAVDATQSQIEFSNIVFKQIDESITRAFGTERIDSFRKGIQNVGNEITRTISQINDLARVSLMLPVKDTVLESGTTERGKNYSLYGFSVDSIEAAIEGNENRIKGLILQYASTGNEQVRILLESYQDYVNRLYDLKDQYFQLITGTTPDTIADSIINGFKEGKRSASDFADDFGDMMREALISAMKMQVLEAPLQSFYKNFAAAIEDGSLSDTERTALKGQYESIIAATNQWADNIKTLTGIDPFNTTIENANKLAGAVKGITEETAGIIAGQFYAMRENLLAIKSDTNMIRELIPLDLTYSFTTIRDNAVRINDTVTIMNTTQQQMADTALNQLASINETVGHLASIDKKVTDIAKLNSIDARLEELNRNIKNL